jgi:hypothetical protein
MDAIEVDIRVNYGQEHYYPVSVNAKLFAMIEGNKTLSAKTLDAIDQLGYEIIYTFKGRRIIEEKRV